MMVKKKTDYKYSFSYWQAFMIPFVVMVAGCIGSGIFPFGEQSFLRNDLYNQYMQFFQAFRDRIWQGEGLSYSFELGLGSGFSALYGYYLASPLNWLSLLCPRAFLAEFITVLILVRMGLAGMSFAFYLRRHFGSRNDIGILMFSSAYALSGFMAAYQWNIMWLEVIVLAPMVLWALEELVHRGKGSRYCLLLALSIFTNFYLSIMLCIFLVLYFLVLIIWKPWRVKCKRALQFAFYSALAGGMAGALLLPVYLALTETKFHEFNFPNTVKWYMNFLEELSRHFMNVSMKVQADHWPNIYCGTAILVLIPLFVCNGEICWKEKLSKLFLAAIFLLSFACNVLDFVWHGFNYPDSLPARQGYLYTWLLLVMGYQVYLKLRYIRVWHIILSGVLAYGVIIAAWCFTEVEGMDTSSYVLTLVFVSLYLLLLLGVYAWQYPAFRLCLKKSRCRMLFRKRCLGVKTLVLALVVAELACNTYMTSIRTVNRTKYMQHYQDAQKAVDWLKQEDDGLYRTELFERLTKNDGMMWGINTATVFSSTIHSGVVDFYKALGLGTTRVSYWYQGATPLTSALLGVKYMIGKDDSMQNDLYELVYSDSTGYLYKNNYSLPMGYVLDTDLEEAWDLSEYNPVHAQNRFCHLLGINGDLLVPIESTRVNEKKYSIDVDANTYVYVYLGNNPFSEIKVKKGEDIKRFKQVSFDYLLDLGMVKVGEPATLEIVKDRLVFNTFEAYQLNRLVLEEAIEILSKNAMQVTEYKEGYIKGNITLDKTGQLVLSVPMEKGWNLYVNGEETPIDTFKDAFMAVELAAGSYELEWKYETPGIKDGMLLSGVCTAIFLYCCKKEYPATFRKRMKKQ